MLGCKRLVGSEVASVPGQVRGNMPRLSSVVKFDRGDRRTVKGSRSLQHSSPAQPHEAPPQRSRPLAGAEVRAAAKMVLRTRK